MRRAAAHALGARGEWRAASLLAAMLDDAVYDVRIAAATALQGIGAPGTLMLGRAARHGPPRAAALARQSLDVIQRLEAEDAA